MNGQFIQGIRIEWNLIGAKSYLRNIEALNSLQELMFKKPVTFFVGENGSGKYRENYLFPLPLPFW